MTSRARAINLALIALGLALGAVTLARRGVVSKYDRDVRRGFALPLSVAGASRVTVETDAGTRTFVRADGWASRELPDVDPSRVDAFLRGLDGAHASRSADEAALRPPPVGVVLALERGPLHIFIGRIDDQGGRAVTVEGTDTVYVGREDVHAFDVDLDSFRDRALFPFAPRSLDVVTLRHGERSTRLVRLDASSFRDERGLVSSEYSNALLTAYGLLDARSFGGDAPAAKEATSLVLEGKEGRGELLFGGRCEGGGIRFHREAPPPSVTGCLMEEGALALVHLSETGTMLERHVVTVSRDEIAEIEISRPGAPKIDLARAGSSFRVRAPVARTAEGREVEELERALDALHAEAKPSAPPLVSTPIASLTLRSIPTAGDEHVERVELARDGTRNLARRPLDDVWFELPLPIPLPEIR